MSEVINQYNREPLDPEEINQIIDCKPVHYNLLVITLITIYILFVFYIILKPYLLNNH